MHRHADLAFLEAELADSDGVVLTTATATARVIPLSAAQAEA
ncbi:MAG TPA: hypothetical protein VN597_19160 [Streptosporangiaceae bacterium]|nr:hypothetical protein [Streptosporangiaceae bacterium]